MELGVWSNVGTYLRSRLRYIKGLSKAEAEPRFIAMEAGSAQVGQNTHHDLSALQPKIGTNNLEYGTWHSYLLAWLEARLKLGSSTT